MPTFTLFSALSLYIQQKATLRYTTENEFILIPYSPTAEKDILKIKENNLWHVLRLVIEIKYVQMYLTLSYM